jgi:hypothetical protein
LTLDQSKTARIGVAERADLQVHGIRQLSPYVLIAAVVHGKAVGVMNGGPVVVDLVAIVRVEQEHAGQRRYSCLRNLSPRIEHRLDIEDRLLTGTNGKAVGTRGARAVEQRVNHNGIRIGLRLLDPERCEDREFLALWIRSIDR